MPLPTERLTENSTKEQALGAVQRAISQLVREGREQSQAVAIAFDSARKHHGDKPYLRK